VKVYFKIVVIVLFVDFFASNLFLKDTQFWKNDKWEKKYHRIKSDIYHHDLKANIDVYETWGGKLERKIITNSLGFRDNAKNQINKVTKKKRILLIGDSFIEGSGYNYEFTLAGLLSNKLGEDYQILNSAVESYSPSIYFKKTQYFIDEGFKFDKALIFLDLSDIYDELLIKIDNSDNIISSIEKSEQTLIRKFKNKIYSIGWFMRDNLISFRFFYLVSDKTEEIKNYVKLKSKAAKLLNKNFFKTTRDDAIFYRMTHIDRGFWTFDNEKFEEVKKGLKQADEYLIKLFNLLKQNEIEAYLIIYPWPTQILYGDNKHAPYWENFSKVNNINFINLYNTFQSERKRDFIFENFIYGDIHWNKQGTLKIFNEIINRINF